MWIKYINQFKQEALLQIYGASRNNYVLSFCTIRTSYTDWSLWGNVDMDKITEEDAIRTFNKIENAMKNGENFLDLTVI